MYELKTNTAVRIAVGPLVDPTDGKTAETSLTVTGMSVEIFQIKNDGNAVVRSAFAPTASGGDNDMVHVSSDTTGMYDLELTASNLNFLGNARIAFYDVDGFLVHWIDIQVVSANFFDWKYGTGNVNSDVIAISGDTTAADNLESYTDGTTPIPANATQWKGAAAPAMTGDAYARLGAPAGASVSADIADIHTDVADVHTDVGTAITNIGDVHATDLPSLKTVVDDIHNTDLPAVKSDTAAILTDTGTTLPASIANLPTDADVNAACDTAISDAALATASALATVDTVVDAIKAKTDLIPASPAGTGDIPSAAAIRSEIDSNSTQLAAIVADTNEIQAELADGGRTDLLIDGIKSKTDTIPASPAAVGSAMVLTAAYDAAKTAATQASVTDIHSDIAALNTVVDVIPTLAEIEASTVLAKEATVGEVRNLIGHYTLTSPTFDAEGNLLTGTITTPGDTYAITATYDIDGNLATYEVTP